MDENKETSFRQQSKENSLSNYDKAVLNQIFHPNLPYVDDLEGKEDNEEEVAETEIESEILREINELEIDGVKKAEEGNTHLAVEIFTEAIRLYDKRASLYNNRAQAYRILSDITSAKSDLDEAIFLSNGKGRAARQAYTQRALLYKLQGEDDRALDDFKKSACLGSDYAKFQVVAMNPYAAMCNAVMTEYIEKIRSEQN